MHKAAASSQQLHLQRSLRTPRSSRGSELTHEHLRIFYISPMSTTSGQNRSYFILVPPQHQGQACPAAARRNVALKTRSEPGSPRTRPPPLPGPSVLTGALHPCVGPARRAEPGKPPRRLRARHRRPSRERLSRKRPPPAPPSRLPSAQGPARGPQKPPPAPLTASVAPRRGEREAIAGRPCRSAAAPRGWGGARLGPTRPGGEETAARGSQQRQGGGPGTAAAASTRGACAGPGPPGGGAWRGPPPAGRAEEAVSPLGSGSGAGRPLLRGLAGPRGAEGRSGPQGPPSAGEHRITESF